jgi:hypothetical protein
MSFRLWFGSHKARQRERLAGLASQSLFQFLDRQQRRLSVKHSVAIGANRRDVMRPMYLLLKKRVLSDYSGFHG